VAGNISGGPDSRVRGAENQLRPFVVFHVPQGESAAGDEGREGLNKIRRSKHLYYLLDFNN
jgi:hypothetical protein